jgi:hypothetical protein
MQFQRETLFDVVEEVQPLLEEHYRELAKNQHVVKLKPDWDRYATLERDGGFVVWTVRDDTGALLGYAAFFVARHPHYMDLTLVNNDVLFLDKAHRTGRTGVRFIRYCEQEIAEQFAGACIAWHAKEGTALSTMLGRMGYGVQDIIFAKLLA